MGEAESAAAAEGRAARRLKLEDGIGGDGSVSVVDFKGFSPPSRLVVGKCFSSDSEEGQIYNQQCGENWTGLGRIQR